MLPARPTTQKFLAVYARASDQVNDPTHPGKIRATLEAVNGWFATQTTGGVQPRFQRRSDDEITVQSVVLDLTAAEFAAASFADERASISRAVHPAADTKLVVVIDAAESSGCGITGSDVTLIGEATCNIHTTSPATWPAAATYLVGHEMTHNFGAASSCAPHADGSGHVTDDNRDVIWTGSGGRDFGHLMLDVGHDDYYGLPGGSPCYDIQDSPYWTDTSDPLS